MSNKKRFRSNNNNNDDSDNDNNNNTNNNNNNNDDDDGMCCCNCGRAAVSEHTCLETGRKLFAAFCNNDIQPVIWKCQDGTSKTPTGEGYSSAQVCKGCYIKFNPTKDGNDDGGKVVTSSSSSSSKEVVNNVFSILGKVKLSAPKLLPPKTTRKSNLENKKEVDQQRRDALAAGGKNLKFLQYDNFPSDDSSDESYAPPPDKKSKQDLELSDDEIYEEYVDEEDAVVDLVSPKSNKELLQNVKVDLLELGYDHELDKHKLGRERVPLKSGSFDAVIPKTNRNVSNVKTSRGKKKIVKEFTSDGTRNHDDSKVVCTTCTSAYQKQYLVGIKKSITELHLKSEKHVNAVAAKENPQRKDVLQLLSAEVIHTRVEKNSELRYSSTTTEAQLRRRLQVTYAYLLDGLPLQSLARKVGPSEPVGIRALLVEGYDESLSIRAVKDEVKVVRQVELDQVQKEINDLGDTPISIIIDLTPHCAEVFGMIICFVDKNGNITFRCTDVQFYSKSLDRSDVCLSVLKVLINNKIDHKRVKFVIADGCITNVAAVDILCKNMRSLAFMKCVSHGASLTGKELQKNPDLKFAFSFVRSWSSMMSRSPRASAIFKDKAQLTTEPATNSEQRWYHWYEVLKQVYENSGAVRQTIIDPEDFAEDIREDLKEMISVDKTDEAAVKKLRSQLATAYDLGKGLVQLCYSTERSGFQCAKVYDHWLSVLNRFNTTVDEKDDLIALSEHLPAVHENALALCESSTSDEYKEIMSKAVLACSTARNKMRNLNDDSYENTLRILRACRFFNYEYCASRSRTELVEEVTHLYSVAYFSDEEVLKGLKRELSDYIAAAKEFQAVDEDEDHLWTFWRQNRQRLPLLFKAAREVATTQPSSAAIERLFSYLTNGFNDNQKQALEDIKATQVMVRHNESMRGK